MSTPVPLGVRIYQIATGLDRWVTRWVSDISFRSVIPGGFASANITLHNDGPDSWSRLAKLFNRVQVVDLRTMEIAWEGRVDTARRDSQADTWELGCLGSMVCATDIRRPMFYIDSSMDSWIPNSRYGDAVFQLAKDDQGRWLRAINSANTWLNDTVFDVFAHQRGEELDVFVGRFDVTFAGAGTHANLSRFATRSQVSNGGGSSPATVDTVTLNTAATRRSGIIVTDFSSTTVQRVQLLTGNTSATTTTTTSDNVRSVVVDPRVQVQRVDRSGAKLRTAASYPQEYLTVAQIVEDVLGRYLVTAWHTGFNDTPYRGQVRPGDAYIDASSTAQITHLAYWDGATAAEILGDLMTAQTDAYWAIWESDYGAQSGTTTPGYRFEWARWPAGWGYRASSIDGLQEQPDGGEILNFLFYQYPGDDPLDTSEGGFQYLQTMWDENNNQLLADAQLVRAETVRAEERMSSATGFARAQTLLGEYRRTLNTGTLTVRRPVHLYDPGTTSSGGMSRMLDPWMIRPGRLIRITDLPARAASNDLRPTPAVPPAAQDGVVFRVVGTTYNSGDNSCVLELDTVPGWELANQVAATKPSGKLVARG